MIAPISSPMAVLMRIAPVQREFSPQIIGCKNSRIAITALLMNSDAKLLPKNSSLFYAGIVLDQYSLILGKRSMRLPKPHKRSLSAKRHSRNWLIPV